MNLTLVAAPDDLTELILQSVCDHLRRNADLGASPPVEPSDLDYIRACTMAAVNRIDGPQGRIRRALLTQTWKVKLDSFPYVIELPLPPVQSITSFKYLDSAGTQQTLAADKYRLSGVGSWLAELAPAYGETWPATRSTTDAVEVTFVTGFGDSETDIPADILMAIRQLAAHWYSERQPVTFAAPAEIPLMIADILAPWKVFR